MANRYDERNNFVPAYPVRRDPMATPPVEVVTDAIRIDTSLAGKPIAARDSISATDRAKGSVIRGSMVVAILAVVSLALTILYSMSVDMREGKTDEIVFYLLSASGMSLLSYLYINRLDYRHTAPGVEHRRIAEAGKTVRHIESEREATKRMALQLQWEDMRHVRQIEEQDAALQRRLIERRD